MEAKGWIVEYTYPDFLEMTVCPLVECETEELAKRIVKLLSTEFQPRLRDKFFSDFAYFTVTPAESKPWEHRVLARQEMGRIQRLTREDVQRMAFPDSRLFGAQAHLWKKSLLENYPELGTAQGEAPQGLAAFRPEDVQRVRDAVAELTKGQGPGRTLKVKDVCKAASIKAETGSAILKLILAEQPSK